MYVGYVTNFSQNLLDRFAWKFSGMICHHPRTNWLDLGSDQVKSQGQGHEKVKNHWTELHEIFSDDLSSSKDQSIRFWERSGQRSRSRKGQKHIFVIPSSVFLRFIWNQRQNVHFSIPYPRTNVASAKVCALPSARSSVLLFIYLSIYLFIYLFFFFLQKPAFSFIRNNTCIIKWWQFISEWVCVFSFCNINL